MRHFVAALLWCALGGIGMAQTNRIDDTLPNAPSLAPRGAYDIGVRTITVTDPDRIDVLNGSGADARSEERRVGKECDRVCRSRWSPYH